KKLWEREQEDWRLKKSNLLLTKNIGEGVARNSVRAQGKTFPSLKNRTISTRLTRFFQKKIAQNTRRTVKNLINPARFIQTNLHPFISRPWKLSVRG
ncbi:MAG: hypothetical protein IJL70_04425, partial [Treponema sp.]|nr:hypothetical protein [Treponema sp.]